MPHDIMLKAMQKKDRAVYFANYLSKVQIDKLFFAWRVQ